MVLSDAEQYSLVALEIFTARAAVPILYDDPANIDQIGTGTLFQLNQRCFLITAAHLFDNREHDRFAIPVGRGNSEIRTLGPHKFFTARESYIDIAILELLDPETIASAGSGWQILTPENTSIASDKGTFILCGYPSERAWRRENVIGGKPTTVFTTRIDQPINAEQPVDAALDLFFHYNLDAPNIDGETIATPHLGGTSGASVWEYQAPTQDVLWVPEKTLRVVGIQSAFLHKQYFRAQSWAMVSEIIRQAYPVKE